MSLLHMKIIKKKENKRKTRLMLNIEKYKDNILNSDQSDIACCVIDLFHNGVCPDNCKDCKKAAMKWLLSEYKVPILDDVAKEYLSAVIRPFRTHVTSVRKWFNGTAYQIIISLYNADNLCQLPRFPLSSEMYKGMEVDRKYNLEELDL